MEWFYFASAVTNDALSSQQFNDGLAAGIGALFASIYRLLMPMFSAIGFVTVLILSLRMMLRRRR